MFNEQNVGVTKNYEQPLMNNTDANRSLIESLQQGGYILFARHAEATVGVDQPNLNYYDCSTQRNLSERGRQQAITYGGALRRMRIPIMNPVLTSPFCRNRETAVLAFGEQNVRIDPFWVYVYNLSGRISQWDQVQTLNYLSSILATPPASGSNKVIIAHSFPSGVGFGRIPNMGTIIIRPFGQGRGFEVVDRLTLADLVNLGE